MTLVRSYSIGEIALIVADNPPVNALSLAVRKELLEAVRAADADPAVGAIVLRCDGSTFFAGADIAEFGKPLQDPNLPQVVEAIENCSKAVVAAIHGTALGGGLEIALGCHFRVAVPSAKLGLPEVKLGLLPGAGGTQRLPRLVGTDAALRMIVTGAPVAAPDALAAGLVDLLVDEGSLEADAVAFARSRTGLATLPRLRTRPLAAGADDPAIFEDFRKSHARQLKGLAAPEACIAAVQAAVTLPFEQGMRREHELFAELLAGPQSRALQHAFFAERAAAKIDGLPRETASLPIRRIGILGAGTMGGGIAMNFLSAGYEVILIDREAEALDRGVATIRRNYENSARKGRLSEAAVARAMALLRPTLDFGAFADCDLVIEAVFEQMDIKQDVFRALDGIVRPGAILATNTSFLNVDEIAAVTDRPDHVIGLHFFSPANVMRLLEVVRGARTAPAVLATCMALARKIGKVAVVSGVCHGFIGNRMLEPYHKGANRMLEEGAMPAEIDRVLLEFGMPMGIFQMADLAGLDLGWDPATSSGSTLRELLCERGRRGQKAGRGFYDYDENRNRTPSPEVEALIADFAARSGKAPRPVNPQEVIERLFYPLVNEGAKILEEGIAQRASDIDVVWLNGYGWPASTGGPMFWADRIGLDRIVAALDRHAPLIEDFRMSALLRDKAASGGSLT
ncbi:MAG TPA: 3-hydroxyacyl-CoA dehydrogenase NAD-binding domain-containing protein [Allosphingosinicella sp.]|nr:3-hydroxyacyl-CoA dehydrogenase NAD-binding domain-containing protein [Allosphingosinicella sp.]